jgi:hypothetical protein
MKVLFVALDIPMQSFSSVEKPRTRVRNLTPSAMAIV